MGSEIEPTERPAPKRERRKSISPRVLQVIELLATRAEKTQTAACERVGLHPRSFQLAVQRPHVQEYLTRRSRTVLGVSQARAAERMKELMDAENSMTAYHASKFTLGVSGIMPPQQPTTLVQLGMAAEMPGYIINLRRRGEDLTITPADVAGLGPCGGVLHPKERVIEGTTRDVTPRDDRAASGRLIDNSAGS